MLDINARKRHYHETEKGKVKYFSVQLEINVNGKWKVAVRYDCSHGFAHIDKYDIKGKRIKRKLNLSFESALTFGEDDIDKNWLIYKNEFLKGLKNE